MTCSREGLKSLPQSTHRVLVKGTIGKKKKTATQTTRFQFKFQIIWWPTTFQPIMFQQSFSTFDETDFPPWLIL